MSLDIFCTIEDVLVDDYIFVDYELRSTVSLADAAYNIALGQSIGNPAIRNEWETAELVRDFCCRIVGDAKVLATLKEGRVTLAFPVRLWNWASDGISQLLCILQGGQSDIASITRCRVVDVRLPSTRPHQSHWGLTGLRVYTGRRDKPFLGGIVKPKVGLSVGNHVALIRQMVDGGCDFIKEDEILANQTCCPFTERLAALDEYMHSRLRDGHGVMCCVTINGDPDQLLRKAEHVARGGVLGVHINVWSGLGAYAAVRRRFPGLFIHYQRSGINTVTDPGNKFSVSWPVLCMLAALSGVDSIHVGMLGGYGQSDEAELHRAVNVLRRYGVVPSLSCGMNPKNVTEVTRAFGNDYIAASGGFIHGEGTLEGTRAMRQAIDGQFDGAEYVRAMAHL